MKKTLTALALTGLLLAACSDDKKDSATTTSAPSTFDLASLKVNDAAKACADGKTLKRNGHITTPQGEFDIVYVFEKQ